MSSLSRAITVRTSLLLVADYLSDLTTSVEWDPHTQACRRLDSGSISLQSRYEHTRVYGGYQVMLPAQVISYEPRSGITWRGENEFARGREQFVFATAHGGGTTVTHTVDVELLGVARLGLAMVPAVMRRIADEGTPVLRSCLELLGRP